MMATKGARLVGCAPQAAKQGARHQGVGCLRRTKAVAFPAGKRTLGGGRVSHKVRGYPAYQEEPVEEPKRWPDPDFIEETLAAFPDDGVADIEQGYVSPSLSPPPPPSRRPALGWISPRRGPRASD